MQSIIAEEAIDSIRAKALKYRALQWKSKKAEVSLSENEIDELKRYYNKYKQYTQQELKKKKANEIISNCTHECESSTLDKTKHKRNYIPPSANKTINDMDDDVPQDRLVRSHLQESATVQHLIGKLSEKMQTQQMRMKLILPMN